MGRHRDLSGRMHVGWLAPLLVIVLIGGGTAVAKLSAGVGDAPHPADPAACAGTLSVVAAASFAPTLAAVAPAMAAGPNCARLDVVPADGRAAAATVAERSADVWIPDDAAWAGTQGMAQLAAAPAAGAGTVLATSPLYLVADPGTAVRLTAEGGGWLGVHRLLTAPAGASPVTLALRDPAGSGDGMLAAGAVGEAVWITEGMDASAESLLEAMTVTRTVTGTETALPRSPGEVGVLPEHALLPVLRAGGPAAGYRVLAPTDHTALLRYSWFPTAAAIADPAKAGPLGRLLETLTGAAATPALATAGLRRPDATGPPGDPVPQLPPVAAPPYDVLLPHHVDHVFTTWYPADRRADVLVAVDVSGSMNARVPGSDRRLIDVVKDGFADLGRVLPDDSQLGLWEFGVKLSPADDHQVLLPSAALTRAHRDEVSAAVNRLRARTAGTGLHDTILAAYLAARDQYRKGVPDHVVVFTDGRNEKDPGSLTLEQLTQRLIEAQDPARPVRLTVVAFGDQPDVPPLKQALLPVKGYVGQVRTAEGVARAFMHTAAGGLHD
jgi:Bacterial extracellular solute-binding protein/von Willebrand factor type A domain